jgi:hypothetical protein
MFCSYYFSDIIITSIVKISLSLIDIKIIETVPHNGQSNINSMIRSSSIKFNVPIDNPYIVIESIILNGTNSKPTFIEKSSKEKNNLIFDLPNLENFNRYYVTIKYKIEDFFSRDKINTKTWTFTTASDLSSPSDRSCDTFIKISSNDNITHLINRDNYTASCTADTIIKLSYRQEIEMNNYQINGSNSSDAISGGVGNDIINGNNGDDVIFGSDGNDTIYGGLGNDYLSGRNGNDVIYAGGKDLDQFPGGGISNLTVDEIEAGGGDDLIYSDGGDYINCGPGIDTLYHKTNNSKYLNCENFE